MRIFKEHPWLNVQTLPSRSFVCWNCGNKVASILGYGSTHSASKKNIYLCNHCECPNVFDARGDPTNSILPGEEIKKLPDQIASVYDEVRKSIQATCFTGAIMLMRKIIMNMAVQEGAKDNLTFEQYVDYLYDKGVVPKKSKKKVDYVRLLGNSANHQIENRTKEESENCFDFIEMLLKVNYEFADEEELK